jgi:hypothetical protein
MRKIASSFLSLSLLCLLSASPALAERGEMSERVTFTEDVMIGNTLVKNGTYKLVFEPESGMLKVMDGKDVVAHAKATMRVNDEKADNDVIYTITTAAGRSLKSVKFGGQREEVVLSDATSDAAASVDNFDEEFFEEHF